jgi:phage portal protein BeeE
MKYINTSNLVQRWSIQQLKNTALSCHSALYVNDAFDQNTLETYDACLAELEARGYKINENKSLTITKD